MPTDTRPNQTTSSNSTTATTENIDPELLAQLNSKKEMLVEAFTQVSNALRYAAKACDEFQLLVPRDVGIVSGDMAIGSGSNTTGFHNIHQHNQSIGNQRKFKKNQVKDPNAPKRPNTAYILFSNEIRSEIKAANPKANQKEIVTLIGQKWKALSREQKKVYEDRYFADKERYDEELRAYRATHGHESPASTSSNEDNGESSNNNNTLKTDSSSTFIPVQQQEVTSTSVVGGERIPSSETNIGATTTSAATRLLDPQSTSTEQTEKTTTTASTSEDNNNDDSKKRALPETHNDNDKNEGETIGGDRRRRRRGKGRW